MIFTASQQVDGGPPCRKKETFCQIGVKEKKGGGGDGAPPDRERLTYSRGNKYRGNR